MELYFRIGARADVTIENLDDKPRPFGFSLNELITIEPVVPGYAGLPSTSLDAQFQEPLDTGNPFGPGDALCNASPPAAVRFFPQAAKTDDSCYRITDPATLALFLDTPLPGDEANIEFDHSAGNTIQILGPGDQCNTSITRAFIQVEVRYKSCACSVTANDNLSSRVCYGATATIPVTANDSTTCGTIDCGSISLLGPVPPGFSVSGCNVLYDSDAAGAPTSGVVEVRYTVQNTQNPPCQDDALVRVTVCDVTANDDLATRVCYGATAAIPVSANDATSCGSLNCGSLTLLAPVPPGFSVSGCNVLYDSDAVGAPLAGPVEVRYRIANTLAQPCVDDALVRVTVCSTSANDDLSTRVCYGATATIPVTANDTTTCGALDCTTLALVAPVPPGFSVSGCNLVYDSDAPGAAASGVVEVTYRIGNTESPACVDTAVCRVAVCSTSANDTLGNRVCYGATTTIPIVASTSCGTIDCTSLAIVGPTPPGVTRVGCSFVYDSDAPGAPLSGVVQFTYRIGNNDVPSCTDEGLVRITVCSTSANDDLATRVCYGATATIPVAANDSTTCGAIDCATLTLLAPVPAGFSVVGCNVVYDSDAPGAALSGAVEVAYRIGNGESPPCTDDGLVRVTVCSTTANDDLGTRVCYGSTATIAVTSNDSTTCGSIACGTLSLLAPVPAGFSVSGCNVLYDSDAPGAVLSGVVEVAYRIGNGESPPCTDDGLVRVTVCSTTANDDLGTRVCYGATATIPVAANDTTTCGSIACGTLSLLAPVPAGFSVSGCNVLYDSDAPGAALSGVVEVAYRIGNGESPPCTDDGLVRVTVCSTVANDDLATRLCYGATATIPVTANDVTTCGALDCGTLTLLTPVPAGFSVSGCSVLYDSDAPGAALSGVVEVRYRVGNDEAVSCSDDALVRVTVCSTSAADTLATRLCYGATVTVPVSATTTCGAIDCASLAIVGAVPPGISVAPGGCGFVYDSDAAGAPVAGVVEFTYRIGNGESPPCTDEGLVRLTVCSTSAVDDLATRVCYGSTTSIAVTANDSTSCGSIACGTLSLLSPVPPGFSISGCSVVYDSDAPGAPAAGVVEVRYSVGNDEAIPCTDDALVRVTVCSTTANDNVGVRVCYGATTTIPVTANDTTSCGALDCASLAFVGAVPPGFSIAGCGLVYDSDAPGAPSSGVVEVRYRIGNDATPQCTDDALVRVTVCSTTANDDLTTRVCSGAIATIPVTANDSTACGALDCASLAFVGAVPPGFSISGCNVVFDSTAPGAALSGPVEVRYSIANNLAAPCVDDALVRVTVCSTTAVDDLATRVCYGSTATIAVAANDTTSCGSIACGTLTLLAPVPAGFSVSGCNVLYDSDAAGAPLAGVVEVAYRIGNGETPPCTDDGLVRVTVCNTTANDDLAARVCYGATTTIAVTANDTSSCGALDCTSLAFVGAVPPGFALAGCNVVYDSDAPGAATSGVVEVRYRIGDGGSPACSDEALVRVTVCTTTAVDDLTTRICHGTIATIPVASNDTTTCGAIDCATLALVGPVPPGFSISGCNVVYDSNAAGAPVAGTVEVAYRIGNGESPPCTDEGLVRVRVCSITALDDTSGGVCYGATASIPVTANDSTACGAIDCAGLELVAPVPAGFSVSGCNVVYDSDAPGAPATGVAVARYRIRSTGIVACSAEALVSVPICTLVAKDDQISACQGNPTRICILDNDTSTCGPLSCGDVVIVVPPQHGSVVCSADCDPGAFCDTAIKCSGAGCVRYVPDANYVGPDSFEYEIGSAGDFRCAARARVDVQVLPKPIAVNDDYQIVPGVPFGPFDVRENDDPGTGCDVVGCGGATCVWQACPVILEQPLVGTLAMDPSTCAFMYTAPASFTGTATFTYEVRNSCGCCARATVTIGECPTVNHRAPGSLLLYPEFDNRPGALTLLTLTNSACDYPTNLATNVEFVYIDADDCLESNYTVALTPCDTITVLTSAQNPNVERGYVYAFAKNSSGKAIAFDYLIGQLLVLEGVESNEYSVNPLSFRSPLRRGQLTDVDDDGIRDLDRVEYDKVSDEILVPRFLGQDAPGPLAVFDSDLVLVGLSGGAAFDTTVAFLVYNDNEEVVSFDHTFRCWEKRPLLELSSAFGNEYLKSIGDDPTEILGSPARESGWMRLKGRTAQSVAETIVDPAIYAFLIERTGPNTSADLPFEQCARRNGDLLPRGIFGDGPDFVAGDNE